MIEIRIHGRGGQGGVTLAKLIAASRFLQGQSVQAFGLYAAERSGAPQEARPATVDACQSLAQWSTLLVRITARANFWAK